MNQKFPIYSIGHGNRTQEIFFGLLAQYDINYLVDVRTNPFSKFHSHYNRANLETLCKQYGITYIFMGDSLGGKPSDRSCYNEQGNVIYEKVMETDKFIYSANRLITAYNKNLKVVCMCSELKPCDCHRSKMIGRFLEKNNVEMCHINESGGVSSQQSVINQITGGYEMDLFGELFEFKSNGVYK